MAVMQSDYESLLAACSDRRGAVELLKHHRPYLELLPSMRRPLDSLVPVALPIVRVDVERLESDRFVEMAVRRGRRDREGSAWGHSSPKPRRQAVRLPCDLALLLCDPEWKVKVGTDLFVFVHRPDEGFYDLLGRWRQTQLLLDGDYEWLMPLRYRHVLGERAQHIYPIFAIFAETPAYIARGLKGAGLPYITYPMPSGPRPADPAAARAPADPVAAQPGRPGFLDLDDADLERDPWA